VPTPTVRLPPTPPSWRSSHGPAASDPESEPRSTALVTLTSMASPAQVLTVAGPDGDRDVRISSPDRVIYEATDRTPAITKLEVCQYVAAMGEAFMRALGDR